MEVLVSRVGRNADEVEVCEEECKKCKKEYNGDWSIKFGKCFGPKLALAIPNSNKDCTQGGTTVSLYFPLLILLTTPLFILH